MCEPPLFGMDHSGSIYEALADLSDAFAGASGTVAAIISFEADREPSSIALTALILNA